MSRYAIIGYNNTLSKNIIELLALRGFNKSDVGIFDSKVQGEIKISFGDDDVSVKPIEHFNPEEFDAIIFTGNTNVSQYIRKFAGSGIKIINATTQVDGEVDTPMIVGGINDNELDKANNVINVPNPCVTQLLAGLSGIASKYTIKNIRLSTYMSADFEEQDGMSELYNTTRRILMNDVSSGNSGLFHKTLAFNVIPQVGNFIGEETSNEWLFNTQSKQVLGIDVKIHANCALIPAFVGMGIYANIETEEEIDATEVTNDVKKAKGVLVLDKQEDGGYFSLTDVQGESSIFISRIRQDMTVDNGISLWIAGDMYKIAAQNILAVLKQFLKRDK